MRNEYYDKDPNQLGLIIGSCDGGIIIEIDGLENY